MDFLIHSFLAAQGMYWVGPGLPSFSKKSKIWSFFAGLEVPQLLEQCRGHIVSRNVWFVYDRLKSRVYAHPMKRRHEQRS